MFCKHCGQQIPDDTKFCRHCGAAQETAPATAANPVIPATPVAPTKKSNPTAVIIIAAVAVVCVVLGMFVIAPALSNNKSTDAPISTPANDAAADDDTASDTTDNTPQSDPSPDTNKALQALTKSDNVNGATFMSNMGEYGHITISAGYCTDNDVVYNITFSMKLTKAHPDYTSSLNMVQGFEKTYKQLDDNELAFDLDETADGFEVFMSFDGLELADRVDRIAFAESVLDVDARDEDCAFYFATLSSTLKGYGFQ